MALFDAPAPALLPLLPRLGFSARLRWELSDTYLTTSSDATIAPSSAPLKLTSTNHRPSSAIFYLLSNHPISSTPSLTAVLTKPSNSTDFLFLSLHPNPHLTSTPTLLKLSFHPPSSPTRSLVALQTPLPSRTFLSLSTPPHATAVPSLTKRELFHLEFTPNSIAAGFAIPRNLPVQYFQPTQALSHAILQLGVRIRFRSFHGRVLRKDALAERIVPIIQDGPKTRVDEVHDKELVVTPHRVKKSDSTGTDEFWVFKDIETGLVLSIHPKNQELSRANTLSETPLALVDGKAAKPIRVRYSTHGWGKVHLGCGQCDDSEQWLMAGRGGRLELRCHVSRWETFQVEFVRQSLEMAVRELPESPLVRVANEETKRITRKEIEARVEKVREKEGKTKTAMKKEGFDHGRALAGLSDEPQKARRMEPSANDAVSRGVHGAASSGGSAKSKAGNVEGKTKAKTSGKAAVKGRTVAPAATAASLPRNQANKKAAKRNKKKKQKQKAKSAANAVTSSANPASRDNRSAAMPETNQKARGTDDKSKVSNPAAKQEDSSASTLKSTETSSKSGPPCAACGRPLEGPYVTALGKSFHPGCFCCGRCRRPMGAGAGNFRERGGIPYCDSCYAAHLAPRCARCSQPIMDTVTTAMDKQWHKNCLTCSICGLQLTQTFWLYADKPNEPRCSRCVAGSEEYNGPRRANGRMVNLPMFGQTGAKVMPLATPGGGNGVPGQGGRARLVHPILPNAPRR